MRKLIPYIIGTILAIQATTPPLELSIQFTNSPTQFVWVFLLFVVLAFYFLFTKAHLYLKILLTYLIFNSFLSSIVHGSMTTFIWITAGAYFYLLCLECRDWRPVFKIMACVLLLQSMLALLLQFGAETLLNFKQVGVACYGSVGNNMQFKSLIIILLAFLILNAQSLKKHIKWVYILFIPVLINIIQKPNFWYHLSYARLSVWRETFKLFLGHTERSFAWIIGWGIGTFKVIFPTFARGLFEAEGVWQNAHNEPIELLMDVGTLGAIPVILYLIYLCRKCRGLALLSTIMIAYTLCFYFPLHQPHTSLLLVAFAAYREKQIRGELWQMQLQS